MKFLVPGILFLTTLFCSAAGAGPQATVEMVFKESVSPVAFSSDGTTLIGADSDGKRSHPFIWTKKTGMQMLDSEFTGISHVCGDGRTVLGYKRDGAGNSTPLIWTGTGKPSPLFAVAKGESIDIVFADSECRLVFGTVWASKISQAFWWSKETGRQAISLAPDGRTLVPEVSEPSRQHMLFWQKGLRIPLAWAEDQRHFQPNAVATNGRFVAGVIEVSEFEENPEWPVFRWNVETGTQILPFVPSLATFVPSFISDDGATIMGTAYRPALPPCETCSLKPSRRPMAVVWTEDDGASVLILSKGESDISRIEWASADGQRAIGGYFAPGEEAGVFLWSADKGVRSLHSLLPADYGDASLYLMLVSADGTRLFCQSKDRGVIIHLSEEW